MGSQDNRDTHAAGACGAQADGVPPSVRKELDRLVNRLAAEVGGQLESIVLYGGLARGEFSGRSSNANVMIVLADTSVDVLDRCRPALREAGLRVRIAPLILTSEDLRRSTDCFPIKFLAMRAQHALLWGEDPLIGLEISREHLRLRCEQELKNMLLRLLQGYAQRGERTEWLERTLSRTISALVANLRAIMTLTGETVSNDRVEVIDAAAKRLGLDSGVMHDTLGLKEGSYRPDREELRMLYERFVRLLRNCATAVDEM